MDKKHRITQLVVVNKNTVGRWHVHVLQVCVCAHKHIHTHLSGEEKILLKKKLCSKTPPTQEIIGCGVHCCSVATSVFKTVIAGTEQTQLESSQILPTTHQDSEPATNAQGHEDTAGSSSASARAHTLTIENAHDVFEMMYDAREKWRSIGGIFHLSQATLKNIDSENKYNDDKLREVIIEWLNKYGGTENCTWAHVAMVLRNKTVAREDLAQEVFEQYPQSLSVPPPSLHSSHTSPDSASGATAVVKHSGSHPPAGNVE